ncbi:MAG: hypothetical protein ACLQDY_02765 [Streptosporangiaceae bacterium]
MNDSHAWTFADQPVRILFGQGGSPFLTDLHWYPYNHTGAATVKGYLHAVRAGCTPMVDCPYYTVPVTVTTGNTWRHDGRYYYHDM